MSGTARVLVVTGDGINCERETAFAFARAGAEPEILHINELLANPARLGDFQCLALPGGFSFGDDLGSGQILALKLRLALGDHLQRFVERGNPVLGICNGFQALAKLGLLPTPFEPRKMAIGTNVGGAFQDRWVELEVDERSPCIWTQGLESAAELTMPIRHGEGRITFLSGEAEIIHNELTRAGQIPLRYREDVNGSYGRIAGVCDPKGLVFGLMPHPEAAIIGLQHPRSVSLPSRDAALPGAKIFQNCVRYLRER